MLGGLTAPFPFLFPFPEAVPPPLWTAAVLPLLSGKLLLFLPLQKALRAQQAVQCPPPPPRYPIFLLEEEQFSGLTLCARLQPSPG